MRRILEAETAVSNFDQNRIEGIQQQLLGSRVFQGIEHGFKIIGGLALTVVGTPMYLSHTISEMTEGKGSYRAASIVGSGSAKYLKDFAEAMKKLDALKTELEDRREHYRAEVVEAREIIRRDRQRQHDLEWARKRLGQ